MLVFVLAVASALVFSFLCSVSEAVLLSVGHAQVEKLGKSKAGKILRRFKREIDVPLAAILVLNTVANTAGAAVAGASYGLVFDESTVWIFSLAFTVAVLLFTEILPKTLGVTFAPRLVVPVTVGVFVGGVPVTVGVLVGGVPVTVGADPVAVGVAVGGVSVTVGSGVTRGSIETV